MNQNFPHNKPNKICKYFQIGTCKNGNSCSFFHQSQNTQGNSNFNSNFNQKTNNHGNNSFPQQGFKFNKGQNSQHNTKSTICTFFNKPRGCNRGESCNFLHNYHDSLHHIKKEQVHNDPIVGCVATDNSNFVTVSSTGEIKFFQILPSFQLNKTEQLNQTTNGLSFLDNRLFFFCPSKLIVVTNSQLLSSEFNIPIIEGILQYQNYFFIYGGNQIIVLQITHEISILLSKQTDSNIKSMIFCKENNLFFSSHDSGDLIAWSIENNLSEVGRINISKGSVYVIRLYKNFLLTGDALGEFKIFNINSNFKIEFSLMIGQSIYDIFLTQNCVNKEMFCFSLSSGEIYVYDEGFNKLFSIYSSVSNLKSHMISMNFPQKTQNEGNFFILSENNQLNINLWCNMQ